MDNENVADLRVSHQDVVDALRFCANQECMDAGTVEYCLECRMAQVCPKTEKGKRIASSDMASGVVLQEYWKNAAAVLVKEGLS